MEDPAGGGGGAAAAAYGRLLDELEERLRFAASTGERVRIRSHVFAELSAREV
jgi:hypothetical protein